MIDRDQVRKAMRKKLLAAPSGLLPDQNSGFAWENRTFDPPNGSLWIREAFMPIEEPQVTNQYTMLDAWIEYAAIGPKGKGSEKIERLAKVIGNQFVAATSLTDPINVHIIRTETLVGRVEDVWWTVPVRIRINVYGLKEGD